MASGAHIRRINETQKQIMTEFMIKHPHLARNTLKTECEEGVRQFAKVLWTQLASKLNAKGPPCKHERSWRKVYADQKNRVKKKLASNIGLSNSEQQIIEAAALENTDVVTKLPPPRYVMESWKEELEDEMESGSSLSYVQKEDTSKISILNLLNSNIQKMQENQDNIRSKLQRLFQIHEQSSSGISDEEHAVCMAAKRNELEMKKLELEILKASTKANVFNVM